MLSKITVEPCAQDEKPAADRQETVGIDQIKHAASHGQQRKCADAARRPVLICPIEFLEGETKEQRQPEQQEKACGRRSGWHGGRRTLVATCLSRCAGSVGGLVI
jgi:hypothetical protein